MMMLDRNIIMLYLFVLAIIFMSWDEVSKPIMI
jgi:hypothetical protein